MELRLQVAIRSVNLFCETEASILGIKPGIEWSVSCEVRPQYNDFESDTSSSDDDEDAGPWAAILYDANKAVFSH
jgi:hypothetical protein